MVLPFGRYLVRHLKLYSLPQHRLPQSITSCSPGLFFGPQRSRHDAKPRLQTSATFLQHVPSPGEATLKRLFPEKAVPYLQLMRLDKPTGALLLLWPSLWGIGLATNGGTTPDLYTVTLFTAGAVIMRGAGCTINDIWDRKYDAQVSRTKNRPLASGRISVLSALVFLSVQLSTALYILTRFDMNSIILGASSMILVTGYPLAKRFTNWPQLILGMTFNWGVLLGWSVVQGGELNLNAVLPLYAAGICWTIIYDTIYAHQDKRDDILIGLGSTAILFGDRTKSWLTFFSASMSSSLLMSGLATSQCWPYYASVVAVTGHLGYQIFTLNINDSEDCWKKFQQNSLIGFLIFAGIFASTLFKEKEDEKLKLVIN